jgi:2-methylaconitate cis-trans-isomerase PrpF
MGVMHRAIAVTGSVATAAAAVLPGSIVHDHRVGEGAEVIIGHPSGQISLTAEVEEVEGVWQSKKIALNRTAREIMKGIVFVS